MNKYLYSIDRYIIAIFPYSNVTDAAVKHFDANGYAKYMEHFDAMEVDMQDIFMLLNKYLTPTNINQ